MDVALGSAPAVVLRSDTVSRDPAGELETLARTIEDYRSSLRKLGQPKFTINGPPRLRGGFVNRNYTLHYAGAKDLALVTYAEPGATGRWEQFMIMPK